MEVWKVVNNHNAYEISNYGNFRRFDTKSELKKVISHNGYELIKFNIGTTKTYRVSRLVAEYFVPGYQKHLQVNHIDGVKTNNHFSNLEWCTRVENMQHAFRIGLIERKKGENSTYVKLSTKQVLDAFKSKLTESRNTTAKRLKVSKATISLIQNCKSRFDEIEGHLSSQLIEEVLKSKLIKDDRIRKIYEINKYGEIIKEYKSAVEIKQELGCALGSVWEVARGKKQSIYGRFFIYKDKFTNHKALNRDLKEERKILEL